MEINEKSSVTTAPLPPTTSTSESNNLKKSKLPQKDLQANVEKTSMPKAPQPIEQSSLLSSSSNGKNMAVNAETDDWESIFDDNGECSDPKLIDEITANVGKVTITKPKNDYKCYQETVNLDDEEFPHVLEVSNFPVEFKTQDLMMVFSEYKDLGFDIKWVDDTHALVVFSSSKIGMCNVILARKYYEKIANIFSLPHLYSNSCTSIEYRTCICQIKATDTGNSGVEGSGQEKFALPATIPSAS